ncbi:MAG TPA: hypothetical protein VEA61_08950 [Allosphingosinicella sp.]|nr:hypothetical protein [Allosphingosinicella sp.]
MALTLSLLALALFGLAAGLAMLARPERVAAATGNSFWLRSARRRALFRYGGGGGFLALGGLALLDLLSDSLSILPGD